MPFRFSERGGEVADLLPTKEGHLGERSVRHDQLSPEWLVLASDHRDPGMSGEHGVEGDVDAPRNVIVRLNPDSVAMLIDE